MQNIYEVKAPKRIDREKLVEITVPGSKSITNRALLLAAMAEGTSTVNHCLTSEDARHFLDCLKTLGFPVTETPDGELGSNIAITGFGGDIPCKKAEIYVGSAGTAARFLAAMLAFSDGEYTMQSSEQMKKRPMQPLIDTLREAGAKVECPEEEGHFPLHITGVLHDQSTLPDTLNVDIEKSSQFLSALLIAAGTFHKEVTIRVQGSHGLSYIDLTQKMMESFGVKTKSSNPDGRMEENAAEEKKDGRQSGLSYYIDGTESYRAIVYDVEPDLSAAAYFYAAAAVLGSRVLVKNVRKDMLQGDKEFLKVLEKMGCRINRVEEDIKDAPDSMGKQVVLQGPAEGKLKGGFTVDMSAFSDQALTLAAIAPYADAPVTIRGIGHIRLQECDRIRAIVDNLKRLGIRTEEEQDSVTIYPGTPKGCEIETYDDHRVAMAFALTGLRTEGVKILNPSCCKKTFAQYFEVLDRLIGEYTN